MRKRAIKHIIENIPGLLNNVSEWIKENYEDNAQEILKNTSGSIGLIVKLVGRLLGKY